MEQRERNIRILLVDDEELVREGLRRMLEGQPGIEIVSTATNGADALKKAATLRPDIILTDMKMPGMDGVELTRRVKKEKCHVIMLTWFEDYLGVVMDAGASGYLLKDIRRPDLVAAIRRVHKGEVVISDNISARCRAEYHPAPRKPPQEPKKPYGEDLLDGVQLVLDVPRSAARLLSLISRIEETLNSTVYRLVGSWDGKTAVTFLLDQPAPLAIVMEKLQGIPEIRSVVEIPADQLDPGLMQKMARLPERPPMEVTKTVSIELEDEVDSRGEPE
ncbi:hypothetical protein LCGC14_2013550 [marine sediment metagenome]|uniref:Response regulatory domain-containing protein n=1 Tax=marine sediment metagenome TaxID=412755 RepID=A0A0F9EZK5_9ZZZZ